MMTIIDYLGYRVFASVSLNLSSMTLLYGPMPKTSGGDAVFWDKDPQMRSLFYAVKSYLNIRARQLESGEWVNTPSGVEGHITMDTRRYSTNLFKWSIPERFCPSFIAAIIFVLTFSHFLLLSFFITSSSIFGFIL